MSRLRKYKTTYERPTYTKREPSGGGIGGDLSGVLTSMELMEQPGGMGGRNSNLGQMGFNIGNRRFGILDLLGFAPTIGPVIGGVRGAKKVIDFIRDRRDTEEFQSGGEVFNRPMFQTPQQKAAGGIMAGVAPMYEGMGPMRLEDGGFLDDLRSTAMRFPGAETVADVYDDISSRDFDVMSGLSGLAEDISDLDLSEISEDALDSFRRNVDTEDFFTFDETPEGSGMNLRDLTDAFIFDPKDPIDLATAPLVAFPPAFAIARLAKLGIKGGKLAQQLGKIEAAKQIGKEAKQIGKEGAKGTSDAFKNYLKFKGGKEFAQELFPEQTDAIGGGISLLIGMDQPEEKSEGGIMSLKDGGKLSFLGEGIKDIGNYLLEKFTKKKKKTRKDDDDNDEANNNETDSNKPDKKKTSEESDETDVVESGPNASSPGLFQYIKDNKIKSGAAGTAAYLAGSKFGGDSDSEGQVAELEAQIADLNKKLENAVKISGSDSQTVKDLQNQLAQSKAKIKQLEDDALKEPPPNENILTKALNKLRGAAGSAGSIDPSVLAGLVNMGSSTDLFEPPKSDAQKFLEGRQGFRMQEAEIDKAEAAVRQADASDMLDLEREFNLLKEKAEDDLGRELLPHESKGLLISVRADLQNRKDLMSLFATATPDMLNKERIDEFKSDAVVKYLKTLPKSP